MKIQKVAVIIQNIVQFESFSPAIDTMLKRKINVDILIPSVDASEHIWDEMYNVTAKKLIEKNLKIKRNYDKNIQYDIVFTTHEIEQFKNIKRKYLIKYRYGAPAKFWLSLSLDKNYLYDGILTYGKVDTEALSSYTKTFEIGNIKYAYYNDFKRKSNSKKINILYLPTYGEDSTYFEVIPELIKLKDKYNIMIKLHHGSNHLEREKEIRKIVEENFNKIFSSEESLLDIFKETDLVISENSGAVGDAIAAKIPLVMFQKEAKAYGEFIPIISRITKDDYVPCARNIKELPNKIEDALSKKYLDKKESLFNLLYGCENKETINKFNDFLDKIESGYISEEYRQMRINIRKDYKEKIVLIEKKDIEIETLNERLQNAYNTINRLEKTQSIIVKLFRKIKAIIKK